MASRFEDTKPVIRDLYIDGHGVRVTMDANGVHFIRKGDKHRHKKTLSQSWKDVFDASGDDPYSFLELKKLTAEEQAAESADDKE
jgi:hypothetical protein